MKQKIGLIIGLLLMISVAACTGKTGGKGQKSSKEPAAQVKQSAPAAMMAPQAAKTPDIAEADEPKGPVTVVPEPAAAPEPQTPAPASEPPSAAPALQAAAPAAPIGMAAPIQEGPASPPPIAQGQSAKFALPSSPAEGVIQALPAPSIAPPDAAQIESASPVAFEPKLVKAETNIEIIIDASGSMEAPLGQSALSKFELVKANLLDVLAEMREYQTDFPRNVAVRAIGSKSPSQENNRQDSLLLTPMGQPDLDAVKKALADTRAQGMSPIAFALMEAANDFPADSAADRMIVLVVDGGDNTESDVCAAASKIEEGPVKIVINVIAFDVKPEDMTSLECLTTTGGGKLFVARNENELRSAMDESINSTLPYNLKLAVSAGSIPMPFELAVYKAGDTAKALKTEKGFGAKLLKLVPGAYDIFIEYGSSPEKHKPSKMLKGVEILATTKIEQTVSFDLGELKLVSLDSQGMPAPAHYDITRSGTADTVAKIDTEAPMSFFFAPGKYDIRSILSQSQIEAFSLEENGVDIKIGESTEGTFKFQKGTLSISGMTTQKEPMPFILQAYKTGNWDELVANAVFPAEGGSVELAPGTYDLLVLGTDPKMIISPRTKITGVEIKSAELSTLTAMFEMGVMKLSAVDGQGNKLPAEFLVRDHDTQTEITRVSSQNGEPVMAPVPVGNYDIVASSLKSKLEPKPSVPVTGVAVAADKPVEQVIKFVLGTLRLRGRNAKEQAVVSQFTIYKAGSDEKVSVAPPAIDWTVFDLAPGAYDALAANVTSNELPQPMIWLRDIKVEDGKSLSQEAIFTIGKLKIIGRGPNNKVINCNFKVFQYGSDRELINGTTGDDWSVFEIEPGSYYLEASHHDDEKSVLMKKWINLKVGENEVVEEVLRF